jgi:uncharacterized protein
MTRLDRLQEKAKGLYQNGDAGHDFAHICRVMGLCERIGRVENANIEILLAAAMLHDVVNLPKNHPERLLASQMAADHSTGLLTDAGFSEPEIKQIAAVIREHSYSLGRPPTSIESAVLQDADKLDAVGAIGVMRAVTCGAKIGSSYYDSVDPLAESRELDDKRYVIDHFFTKLLKLPDLMNTRAGRDEAERRVRFVRLFLEQLKTEIGGES